jgi:hypothetical protein
MITSKLVLFGISTGTSVIFDNLKLVFVASVMYWSVVVRI